MTLKEGTGITKGPLFPASSAKCWYNGMPFLAAPAFATARETPKIAFAPRFFLLGVPSSAIMRSSIFFWSISFIPSSFGAMMVFTFLTALRTPLPPNRFLSPSRNSCASCVPVDAPDGTDAVKIPESVCKSTSTVGLPRESMISLACTRLIACTEHHCHALQQIKHKIAIRTISGVAPRRPG